MATNNKPDIFTPDSLATELGMTLDDAEALMNSEGFPAERIEGQSGAVYHVISRAKLLQWLDANPFERAMMTN